MRILITGGAGFIGSHVVEALLAAGHQAFVLDDLSSGYRDNVPAKAEFFKLCITSPEAAQVIQQVRPQAIYHLAAQMDVRKSVQDPVFDASINVVGTVRLVQAGIEAGCQTFIFSSTGGAIYGEQQEFPASESHPTRPESPYGLSKLCAEHYLQYYSRQSSMRTVALRFGNVYGPRQDPHGEAGVVAIFAQKLLNGEVPTIFGDGSQTRDYVAVQDVVRACLAALNQPNSNSSGVFNIGTGIETNVNALARILSKAAGSKVACRYAPARPGEQLRSVISYACAKEVLGWVPQVSLAEGLQTTFAWFADRHVAKAKAS